MKEETTFEYCFRNLLRVTTTNSKPMLAFELEIDMLACNWPCALNIGPTKIFEIAALLSRAVP